MGIYDREYYRREGPSFLGAITNTGQVCKYLILVNVAIFLIQFFSQRTQPELRMDPDEVRKWEGWSQRTVQEWEKLPPAEREQVQRRWVEEFSRFMMRQQLGSFTNAFVLDPEAVLHGQVWRLLTYAFLHDTLSLWHLVFNMLFLWWFGSEVEELYGKREFLAFYLASAVVGGLVFLVWELYSDSSSICLGASGAVTAVLVLFALHYPTRMIYIWFILPVPIWLFVVFQVAQDAFIFLGGIKTGTAVTVHLGGAAFAALYYKMNWRLLGLLPDLRSWQRRWTRPRLRVYREEEPAGHPVAASPAAPPADVDEHLEAKVDAVLEKVARFGRESLTENERQLLLRASEIYRRRRH
ncbi:MAG TPA: rhomboid family intramembrane serine protease [Gemmataceae bacterium]|nr:rhomboid family intramembrane serine protease [Gemmataceae bacterium]